jgi:serine phosphatase RsbU (regulator of sigma subunit)
VAALVTPGKAETTALKMDNVCAGILPDADFGASDIAVPSDSLLYVFSDGTYQLRNDHTADNPLDGFLDTLSKPLEDGAADLARIQALAEARVGPDGFEDDFTVLRIELP